MPKQITFKWKHGDKVTLASMPGLWKVYSPHPDRGFYYVEALDATARALMTLSNQHGSSDDTLKISPVPTCVVETEWGMVKAPTKEMGTIPTQPTAKD